MIARRTSKRITAATLALSLLTGSTLFTAGCGSKPTSDADAKKDAPALEVDLGSSSDSPADAGAATDPAAKPPANESPEDTATESDSEKDK